MTTPTTAELLKYADLQMAAEAFLANDDGTVKADLKKALTEGNKHSSRFTESQATAFADPTDGWTVLDQRANTSTGFSGTLFKSNKNGDLVISFRSTEFIDDAARDNKSTNELEIKKSGWAFGQLSDMEEWYQKLRGNTALLGSKPFTVTGYSLGGHLATALNLMHPGAASATYTFNGAGVGELIGNGTSLGLLGVIQQLTAMKNSGNAEFFTQQVAKDAYAFLKPIFAARSSSVATGFEIDSAIAYVSNRYPTKMANLPVSEADVVLTRELDLLTDALKKRVSRILCKRGEC